MLTIDVTHRFLWSLSTAANSRQLVLPGNTSVYLTVAIFLLSTLKSNSYAFIAVLITHFHSHFTGLNPGVCYDNLEILSKAK